MEGVILLSICIPNYNYGQYISQTISSVLSIDSSKIEIIISDNHSEDDSWNIINNFTDSRIKKFKQKNNIGLYNNWNFVLEKARGKYVKILQSDDFFLSNVNKVLDFNFFEKLKTNNYGLILFNRKDVIFKNEEFDNLKDFKQFKSITQFSHPTLNIMKTSIAKKYYYHNESMRGDLILLSNVYFDSECERILTLNKDVTYIRVHEKNDRFNYESFESIIECYELSKNIKNNFKSPHSKILNMFWQNSLLAYSFLRLSKKILFREKINTKNLNKILKPFPNKIKAVLFLPFYVIGLRTNI